MNRILRMGVSLSEENRRWWEGAGFSIVTGGPTTDNCIVINYGGRSPMYVGPDSVLLNNPERIERTRVENLPSYCRQWMTILDVPVIVKRNGSKGRGKVVCKDGIGERMTVQRFIYPAEEYRIITWDIPGHLNPEPLAWSRKHCENVENPKCVKLYEYLRVKDMPPELRALALEWHVALGLNYVGWDYLKDQEGNFWLIEANSAPGLGEQTSRRLNKRLNRVFGES